MKEFVITGSESGRRLDRFACSILKDATPSFIQKMIRKKNIVVNDKKAAGGTVLSDGDVVKFYFSDESFETLSGKKENSKLSEYVMPPVVYEDDDVLIVDKPAGLLSQKTTRSDISLNEICLAHISEKGEANSAFRGGICNRLDRNTSGLVTFAKTYKAARIMTDAFRERTIDKYYHCIVAGEVSHDMELTGKLTKDSKTNKVKISGHGADIMTFVHPVKPGREISLVSAKLVTGRPHQIRASLAAAGHPILGDPKYGDSRINAIYRGKYGVDCQLLVCTRLVFPEEFGLERLAAKEINIPLPDIYERII